MTPQLRWYYKNREKALADAKRWKEVNPDKVRLHIQRWRRVKAAKLRKEQPVIVVPPVKIFVKAPGYDPKLHGIYEYWCQARGIDPEKSWDEPTDEYFG